MSKIFSVLLAVFACCIFSSTIFCDDVVSKVEENTERIENTKVYETPTTLIFEKSEDSIEPMLEIIGYEDGNLEDVVIQYDSVNYAVVLKDGSICFVKHQESQETGFIFLPDNIDPL